jgi:hypothetical protein
MTGRRTVLFVLFCLLATAGVIIGVMHQPERGPEERISSGMQTASKETIASPRPQQSAGRERREMAFRQIASIESVGEAPLMMPLHVRIDGAG